MGWSIREEKEKERSACIISGRQSFMRAVRATRAVRGGCWSSMSL